MMELRRRNLTRYVTPLREGGSLPALAEADDGFSYVVKFRGAGHGCKALIAELIRWLTAVRSACIRTSRPHPGLTDDLDATFDRLFSELV